MADTFKFELVSPERLLISADVESVIVPGFEGDFMVLPKHAPIISMLRPGILEVPNLDGKRVRIFVRSGFAEAGPDHLTVLAEQAVPVEQLNRGRIDQEIQDAEEDVSDAKDEETKRRAEDSLQQLKGLREVLELQLRM